MLRTVTEIQRPNSNETQVCVRVYVDETQQATRVCSLEFNIKYRQDFRTGASDTALRIQRQSCTATPRTVNSFATIAFAIFPPRLPVASDVFVISFGRFIARGSGGLKFQRFARFSNLFLTFLILLSP